MHAWCVYASSIHVFVGRCLKSIRLSAHVYACTLFSVFVNVCVRVPMHLCCVHMTTVDSDITHSDPTQVKLLQSLGLRSTLITDGSQPVNLFTTAQGLLGAIGNGPSNTEEED